MWLFACGFQAAKGRDLTENRSSVTASVVTYSDSRGIPSWVINDHPFTKLSQRGGHAASEHHNEDTLCGNVARVFLT